jgi:hypothetical protein
LDPDYIERQLHDSIADDPKISLTVTRPSYVPAPAECVLDYDDVFLDFNLKDKNLKYDTILDNALKAYRACSFFRNQIRKERLVLEYVTSSGRNVIKNQADIDHL